MVDKKQQEMKQDIDAELSKKDYYDILGLSKSASEGEIKKAYRTLALRFHPDKNSYEGAKEVFKKVSNAYSVLSDPQKKEHYDRFGPEEERPRPQYQNASANGEDYQYEQFDDLFNAFFGGTQGHHRGRRHHQFRTYSFGGQQNGQNAQPQTGFNLYYIFIIFFVIYTIAPLFESKPNYSTIPSSEYRYKKTTSLLNVEFYVNQKYFEQAKNPSFKRQSEMIIDREYINQLEKNCEMSKKQKRRIEEYAYRQNAGPRRDAYLSQARGVDITTCRLINDIRYNHEDYIRDLTYMR